MIEPSRRHGHSDPRYPQSYFAFFSTSSRLARAAHLDALTSTALDGWEDEGGAPRPDAHERPGAGER